MAERPGDRWLYAVLRELAELRSRPHSLGWYVCVRTVEALVRIERVRPGWG
jgi:hypothetical protein